MTNKMKKDLINEVEQYLGECIDIPEKGMTYARMKEVEDLNIQLSNLNLSEDQNDLMYEVNAYTFHFHYVENMNTLIDNVSNLINLNDNAEEISAWFRLFTHNFQPIPEDTTNTIIHKFVEYYKSKNKE